MSARDDAAVELAAECVYVVRVFLVAEQHGVCGREVREVTGLQLAVAEVERGGPARRTGPRFRRWRPRSLKQLSNPKGTMTQARAALRQTLYVGRATVVAEVHRSGLKLLSCALA